MGNVVLRCEAAQTTNSQAWDSISQRITRLRFPLVLFVVLIHSSGVPFGGRGGVFPAGFPLWVEGFQVLLSEVLARVAVPLFFGISGYLFFRSRDFPADYRRKVTGRLLSLGIPFLLWNLFAQVIFSLGRWHPSLGHFFSTDKGTGFSRGLLSGINELLGLTESPIAFQFWFIRDLIVWSVLGMALYAVLSRVGVFFLGALAVAWLAGVNTILGAVTLESLLFFGVGGLCAIKRVSYARLDGTSALGVIVGAYIVLAATDGWLIIAGTPILWLHRLGIFIGMLMVWYGSPCILKGRLGRGSEKAAVFAFFVFAFHEPLLRIVRKILWKFESPASGLELLVFYLLPGTMVVVLALGTAWIWRHFHRPTYALVVGGRE